MEEEQPKEQKNIITNAICYLSGLPVTIWFLIIAFFVFVYPGFERVAFLLIATFVVGIELFLISAHPELIQKSSYFTALISITILFFLLFYSANYGSLKPFFDFHTFSIKAEGYALELQKKNDVFESFVAKSTASISAQISNLEEKNLLLENWMQAVSDDRVALFKLDELSKDNNFKYSKTADFLANSIRRIDYGFQYLSYSNATWTSYLTPTDNLASFTSEELIDIFTSKCKYRDTIFEFLDLIRNDNQIPEIEKKKFLFWLIKKGPSNLGSSASLYLLSKTGNHRAAPTKPIDENKILSTEFDEWWKEFQK